MMSSDPPRRIEHLRADWSSDDPPAGGWAPGDSWTSGDPALTVEPAAPGGSTLPTDVPTIDDVIEGFVIDALEALPPEFADQLGSVAIVIEEDASPQQLATVGAHGLYGLYQGVPRTAYGADQVAVPSKITLFRNTLLRSDRTPEALAAGVADTVYHEIAHHFGISDARLHELREHPSDR